MEVYIDNMVVKSKKLEEHVPDLAKVFEILRHHRLHLYAAKCAFEVGSRKFLNFMITCHGIKVNPDQINAIQQLNPPRNPKEVQKFMGMIVALNQFVSKSANKMSPFLPAVKEVEEISVD